MSKRQKICLVLPSHWSSNFGGAEYQVRLLLEELGRNGDADIVYLARNVADGFVDSRYTVRRIPRTPILSRLGFWADSVSLLGMLRRERPDVIYQRVGCAYTGICAYYAARNDCRLIWHVSIDSDLSPSMGRFSIVSRWLERAARNYGIRKADNIVAQTNDQLEALAEGFNRTGMIIRNFQPAPQHKPVKASRPKIVWIANFKPAKRPELFIDIVKHLADRVDAEFVMVGRIGDQNLYSDLLREAKNVAGFSYAGEMTIEAVNALVASAHFFVNTSKDEGFPNTFLQAWYRSTAVISLGVDPDDVLSQHGCGVVCENANEAARRIEALIHDESQRDQITARALEYVTAMHSLDNAVVLSDLLMESS